jgi:xylan 1,4-beta-xylosidase
MRKILSLLVATTLFFSCSQESKKESSINTFSNPIFNGFYPDPSICEANGRYYLTMSSFSYFPGLPLFESEDLVNWTQIGHILDRPEQLFTEGHRVSRGLFAPAISYHDGVFYAICTNVSKDGNFIVTATDPAGPWSNPIRLPQLDGIDPSLFFEGDKTYVVYNSIPPDNVSLYDGHRTIRMYELDQNSLSVKGEEYLLVNGGVDISKKPVWIEAPHLYKINDMYYLMCAEGGTGYNHSEVVFRSNNVTGPYEPWDKNPILTQRHLAPERAFPVTTSGHADIVQLANGDWWAVFLACRPYGDNFHNIGRETFLTPVEWTEDGWFVINPGFEEIQYQYPTPLGNPVDRSRFQYSGNFSFKDDFDAPSLAKNFIFLRTPQTTWYELANGTLKMEVRPQTASELTNPSFIAHRQQHHKGSVSVAIEFTAQNEDEKAGLVAFQGEQNHYAFVKSIVNNKPVIELLKASPDGYQQLQSEALSSDDKLELKIDFNNEYYRFLYAVNDEWKILLDSVDGTYLSTKTAGGFVGTTLAMYATSNGQPSGNYASFDWYAYEGNDTVFSSIQ